MPSTEEIQIKCPQCQDISESGNYSPACYFNTVKKVWHCFRCKITGTEKTMEEVITELETKPKSKPVEFNSSLISEGVSNKTLIPISTLPERFLDYSLPEGIFYKSSDGSVLLIAGKDWSGQLRSIKYRKLVGEKAYWAALGSEVGLFFIPGLDGYTDIDKENSILITEGEIDAVTARLLGFSGDIIALQGTAVKDTLLERLKYMYQSVYIATDNDTPGDTAAKYLVDNLPRSRTKRVNLPAGCKDLNELLLKYGTTEAERLFRKEVENDVYSKIQTIDELCKTFSLDVLEKETYKTGYLLLDEKLGGGLRRGELTIVHAKAKTGKTTFINQLLYQFSCSGIKAGIASFEMSIQSDLIPSLYSIALKQNIRKLHKQRLLDGIDFSPLNKQLNSIYFYDHKQEPCDLKSILRFIEICAKKGVKMVAIDHSLFLVKSAKESDEHQELYKRLVIAAVKHDVHIVVVVQAPKLVDGMKLSTDTTYGGAAASHFCFNFLTLQRNKDHDNVLEVRLLACRYTQGTFGEDPVCLKYDRETCSLSE